MVIDKRNLKDYYINKEASLHEALDRIGVNKSGLIFLVDDSGYVEGVLADGDIRRAFLKVSNNVSEINLIDICNKDFVVGRYGDIKSNIATLFTDKIKCIPLVDGNKRILAVAKDVVHEIEIDGISISKKHPCYLIAEIGNNHNGDINLAKKLVDLAKESGATSVKFQMRQMDSLYRKNKLQIDDLGSEYTLDLLHRFQLKNDDMLKVFDHAKNIGITPLCTPWDSLSLKILDDYGLEAYKVASADFNNHSFIEELVDTGKVLICSTGMTTESEILSTVEILNSKHADYVLLHCNSTYPAPYKDINLNYLFRLADIAQNGLVGYSGHERGIAVSIAAVALGAVVVEKHFTLDKTMEGNDHKVSLLPTEFLQMSKSIRNVEEALGVGISKKLSQGEIMNREILAKSIVASKDIKKGQVISRVDLDIKSPGQGLQPYLIANLVGKIAKRDFGEGDLFFKTDLEDVVALSPKKFNFPLRYGIPVRFHDINALIEGRNLDLVEIHLSYRDLDLRLDQFLNHKGYDLDLVVHCPELFEGDHILDLCSDDSLYREKSIEFLTKTVRITEKISQYFKRSKSVKLVVNVGGHSDHKLDDPGIIQKKYKMVAESLGLIKSELVEIIPQTMPPFPWHFGGQRFHNLFIDPAEINEFCRLYNYRICFDISHSALACNHIGTSLAGFINTVGLHIAHMHIADASGVDGEGLQIGDGDIDFPGVLQNILRKARDSTFIPEIWQGHKNNGADFWLALAKLENSFNQIVENSNDRNMAK